jgi:hypothetical protein
LDSITSTADSDDLNVMEQTVEDGTGGRSVTQELAPFFDRAIGGHNSGTIFVALANLQQRVISYEA